MIRRKLSEISKGYEGMGFDERTEKPKLKVVLYSFTILFLIVNEIIYVIYNWDNLENRVNGFKGILTYVFCTMYLVATTFMWKDMKLLTRIIGEDRYKFPFQPTTKRKYLERKIEEEARKLNTVWYYVLVIYVASGTLTSLLVFLIQIGRHGIRNLTVEMQFLPMPFYYPNNYNSLLWYFLVFMMQLFVNIESAQNTQFTAVASMICMKLIEGDLKLLRLSLEEMDSSIIECKTNLEQSDLHTSKGDSRTIGMKMFLAYFVRHHYDIHRKVTETTNGMKVMAFTLCSVISLLICMTIYSMVKGNVLVFKIQELCFCFTAMYCQYCLDLMGENISSEDKNLREALYQSAWIDKPLWFKSSLQLIMTRTTRMIKMGSTGLFTLDLKSFATILQAAYSFYNMLINTNK